MQKVMGYMTWVAVTGLTWFTAIAAAEPLPLASTLLGEIESNGPRTVLKRIWADAPEFDAVCAAIESANPDWLEVARRLRPVSDAAASLSLNYSVARALPVAPQQVLGLVGRGFTIEDICTSPFIEPEAGVAEQYEQRTLQALAQVKDPKLSSIAKRCAVRVRLPKR